MGHKQEKHAEEAGGEKVAIWYISFADMITLLMSFFVMLSTFCSYDMSARKKLMETVHSIAFYSLAPSKDKSRESIVKTSPAQSEWVLHGSEFKPEDQKDPADPKLNPRPEALQWIPDVSAFRDRRIIRIPASRLFYGDGAKITPQGHDNLKLLAQFISKISCQVVVGSTTGESGGGFGATPQGKLDRAWIVMQTLMRLSGYPAEQFALAGTPLSGTDQPADDAIEITLLSWRVVK
ncbi:MAG: hypothetical protein HZA50_05115 [Planctomycetes bacterium]|nr:hypothetical protein [Planctomycetota bacterium]